MKHKKLYFILFTSGLLLIIAFLLTSIIRTSNYNSRTYKNEINQETLFSTPKKEGVTINAITRPDEWKKIFDFDNVGLTENNYVAHTYDYTISNYTSDVVDKFSFKVIFNTEAYVSNAWNGSIEFHQNVKNNEKVSTIPDLRSYDPSKYDLEIFNLQDVGNVIKMYEGDYLVYIPSHANNAIEVPVRSKEATTPGLVIYNEIIKDLNVSVVFEYTLYRAFTNDVFFWISMIGLLVWGIILIIVLATSLQVRKYRILHERDNKIINESIETFTGFIDAKDEYTNGHSKRVAIYTKLIATEMGFSGEELDRIYYIALLHDCGKIGVPDSILGKNGRLTDEEFEIIKSHTTRGGEILSRFKSLENVGEGARYHHERYDGKGYPEGLKGKDIPLIARMICVADSFDAMNSNRVYRKKLSYDYIVSELENNKGKQFDPEIADIMLKLIKEGKILIEE